MIIEQGWRQTAIALLVTAMLGILAGPSPVAAQEFAPRTYAVTPSGLNFVGAGYAYASGAVLMDPALPAENVDAQVHAVFARYLRTLGLFGRPAKARIVVPWSSGHWEGTYEGAIRNRDAEGIGDIRFVLESQFLSEEVKTAAEMRERDEPWVVGAKFQLVAPTGVYDPEKAINIGSNRWTFIPEVGGSWTRGKGTIEGALAVWIFTTNPDFAGGHQLEQNSLLVAKLHLIRVIRSGFWWAIAGGYGYGGQTKVDGEARATIQRNWRLQARVVYPLTVSQGLVLSVATGGNQGVGSDADAIGIGYQCAW